MRPLIYDASALVALLDGHDRANRLWLWAEREDVPILLPATAVGTANQRVQAADNTWTVLLLGPNIVTLDLTAAGALAASRELAGRALLASVELADAHVAVEARATRAAIVTQYPGTYLRAGLRTVGL